MLKQIEEDPFCAATLPFEFVNALQLHMKFRTQRNLAATKTGAERPEASRFDRTTTYFINAASRSSSVGWE